MIKLQRTRTVDKLSGFTGVKLHAKLEKLLQYHYLEQPAIDFKPKSRQIWGSAKAQLKAESFGKCAYCEADTAVVAHGDVEHFRPKSAYWWLAYCYDNYTFSCQICNQTYKSDKFPVNGKKLPQPGLPAAMPTDPVKLASVLKTLCPDPATATDVQTAKLFGKENADIPYPYTEEPERLFAWKENADTQEVRIVAKGRSARAVRAFRAAEDVLGLNRTELLRIRWNHFDELETLAMAVQDGGMKPAMQKKIILKLQAQASSQRPFAAMKRYFLRKWGVLV